MKLRIESDAFHKVNAYVNSTKNEVGGLFSVTKLENGEFYIDTFYLLEQEVSGGSVDFEGEDLVKLMEKLAKEDKLESLRGSWHSHPTFSTFWSQTDESAIEKYRVNNPNLPWLISLCLNQKGDIASRIDIFDSESSDVITIEDLELEVVAPEHILKEAEEEVQELVKEKKWGFGTKNTKTQAPHSGYTPGHHGSSRYNGSGDDGELRNKPIHAMSDEDWEKVVEGEWGDAW